MEGEFLFSNDYYHLREHQVGVFSALTSWTGIADCDLSELNPQRLACAQVEWNFLPALGVTPILGRNFLPDEDRMNGPPRICRAADERSAFSDDWREESRPR